MNAPAPKPESKSLSLFGPDMEFLRITSRPNYPAAGFTLTLEYQPNTDAKIGTSSWEVATYADVREHVQATARVLRGHGWGVGGSFDAFRYFAVDVA